MKKTNNVSRWNIFNFCDFCCVNWKEKKIQKKQNKKLQMTSVQCVCIISLDNGSYTIYASNQKGQWTKLGEWRVYPEEFNKRFWWIRDLLHIWDIFRMINHKGLLYSFFSFFLSLPPSLPSLLHISWALAFNCKRLQEHSRTVARRGSFINIYMHMKQANSKLSVSSRTIQPHLVYVCVCVCVSMCVHVGTDVCSYSACVM